MNSVSNRASNLSDGITPFANQLQSMEAPPFTTSRGMRNFYARLLVASPQAAARQGVVGAAGLNDAWRLWASSDDGPGDIALVAFSRPHGDAVAVVADVSSTLDACLSQGPSLPDIVREVRRIFLDMLGVVLNVETSRIEWVVLAADGFCSAVVPPQAGSDQPDAWLPLGPPDMNTQASVQAFCTTYPEVASHVLWRLAQLAESRESASGARIPPNQQSRTQ